jgi:imidazolonepropionase
VGDLLFVGARQVVTCAGPARARRGDEMRDAAILTDTAVATHDGRIAAVGPRTSLERDYPGAERIDCTRGILTPGLVDSHTHALFGRPRFEEHELRASGQSYMEIAQKGGGIHASVRDIAARTERELVDLAQPRLARLAAHGTTTLEIKSGYGVSTETELRMLRAIRTLAAELPMRIVPTWLGAHEIPAAARATEHARREWMAMLRDEMLPRVVAEGLASFADVFCEPGVYTVAEARDLLGAAQAAGLGAKLHADELEPSGAAELGASIGAVSVDHLAAISDRGIDALAQSSTVATLLPGTMLFLGRQSNAPARKLIEAGAAVSLASDFNPGSSPTVNFPLILTLGVSQLRLSVAEVLVATTVNGAAALGIAREVGQLAPGFSADLALFEADDIRELPYWYGDRRCRGTWVRGKPCHQYELGVS